jgi:tetratricopeptide (TPR) repeat protein
MINSRKNFDKEEISEKEEVSSKNSSIETEDEKLKNRTKTRAENHKTLHERYELRLKNLDPELITSEDEIALKEAFAYAKEAFGPEELVSWFIVKAEPFYRSLFWQVLLPLYEELLSIFEKKPGSESPEIASVLNGLGGIYRYMGNYEEALRFFSRALKIRENLPDQPRPETGDTLSELGILYSLMEQREEAISFYTRALEIQKKFLSPKNLGAIRTLNRLALFYKGLEKPEKAEEHFRKALELLEKLQEQESDNREVMGYRAGTLNNLGVLLSEIGKLDEAEDRYGQALELQEKVYGLEHPQVAQTLNNLALLYFQTTRYEKAMILYTRSL